MKSFGRFWRRDFNDDDQETQAAFAGADCAEAAGRSGPGTPVTAPDLVAGEVGDDLSHYTQVSVQQGTETVVESTIGDGTFMGNDVDFYRLDLSAGDTIGIDVDCLLMDDGTQLGDAYIALRLFDSFGNEVYTYPSNYDPDNQVYTGDPYLGAVRSRARSPWRYLSPFFGQHPGLRYMLNTVRCFSLAQSRYRLEE